MATPTDPSTRHRNVYTLKDVSIYFYKSPTTPGVAPADWNSGNVLRAIATGFTLDIKQDAALVHGQGTRFPVGTRVGAVSYEWSIDAIYTNDTYSTIGTGVALGQFIEAEAGFFSIKVVAGPETKILTYCTVTGSPVKVTEGECVTCSVSGVAEWVSSTTTA